MHLHINVWWWSFSGVWKTASFLKCSRLFSVIWPFSIMQVFWMVFTRPLISKSSSPFVHPLMTVPCEMITVGKIVAFMFHSFSSSLRRSRYLFFFFTYLQFYSVVSRESKVHNFASFLSFFLFWLLYNLVISLRFGDMFVCQNPRVIWKCHSPGQMLVC